MTFSSQDGDLWFRRNQKALETAEERDWALRLIERNGLQPKRVLEVGCANGWRLNAIRDRFDCNCIGVEPSSEAVATGVQRLGVMLLEGFAHAIPLQDEGFDLSILYFVAHWIERRLMLRSLSEIDRMTMDGGYLLIGDFFPDAPTKVPYHHRKELWTWKTDYAGIFLATGNYRLIDRIIFDHDTGEEGDMSIPVDRRAAVSLLRKEDCYQEGIRP